MNEESYEEYIRSILGYPQTSNSTYFNNDYEDSNIMNYELEEYYPEIYKIVYPMITKNCRNIQTPVTRDMIENITDEIFSAVENDSKRESVENRSKENRGEDRQFFNRNLRDLIKILLIRELVGRPRFPGNRPQVPPPPPRPPFPGRPNQGSIPRLPMFPRDIYEN